MFGSVVYGVPLFSGVSYIIKMGGIEVYMWSLYLLLEGSYLRFEQHGGISVPFFADDSIVKRERHRSCQQQYEWLRP